MVDLSFDDEADNITCEGCGTEIPTFLDGCPYCDDQEGEGDTIPCPSCGADIFELSEKCPICGDWVIKGQRLAKSSFWTRFWVILILAGLFAVMLW